MTRHSNLTASVPTISMLPHFFVWAANFCRWAIPGYCCLILSGCFLFESQESEPLTIPSERVFLHTVAFKGESFPLIAEWYTGLGKNWTKLKNYSGEVGRLYNLKSGSQVRIPESLMIRKDPLTDEFVQQKQKLYLARARKSSAARKTTSVGKPSGTSSEAPAENLSEQTKSDEKLDAAAQDELIENLLLSEYPPDSAN